LAAPTLEWDLRADSEYLQAARRIPATVAATALRRVAKGLHTDIPLPHFSTKRRRERGRHFEECREEKKMLKLAPALQRSAALKHFLFSMFLTLAMLLVKAVSDPFRRI
jgi:hypothetical protein